MRESKVHYVPNNTRNERTQCGTPGRTTYVLDAITCRMCMFGYLAEQAPWAREFLDGLRGAARTVSVPARLTEQVNGPVERVGRSLGRSFRQERGSKKAIRELFPEATPTLRPVQPVMDHGGTAAEPVGVQPGQVAEQAGDAGKVRDEPGWDF